MIVETDNRRAHDAERSVMCQPLQPLQVGSGAFGRKPTIQPLAYRGAITRLTVGCCRHRALAVGQYCLIRFRSISREPSAALLVVVTDNHDRKKYCTET